MAKEDKAMLGLKTGGALSLYPCHTRNIMYIIWCIYCRCGVQDNTIQTIDIQPLPHKLIANQSRYTGSFLGRWDSVERSHSSTPTTPPISSSLTCNCKSYNLSYFFSMIYQLSVETVFHTCTQKIPSPSGQCKRSCLLI